MTTTESPPFGFGHFYTGAAFDTWDSTGTRSQDVDVFTADDLVAVTFLSVRVGPLAAHVILDERRSDFSEFLEMIGPDHDLADEAEAIPRDWPAWELDKELTCLPDVGPTIASKLIARKRPRLVPVYDSVVSKVLGTKKDHWEPIRWLCARKTMLYTIGCFALGSRLPCQTTSVFYGYWMSSPGWRARIRILTPLPEQSDTSWTHPAAMDHWQPIPSPSWSSLLAPPGSPAWDLTGQLGSRALT